MLREVEASIQDSLVKAGARIVLNFPVPVVPFSKKNLRSVLLNLLSNAVKYRSPDRTLEVTLSTEQTDGFVVLSVRDNGLGMGENKHEIFSKFKRIHHHVEGSGIGLYLIKRMITSAGGDIEVESELGKGSVFKVYFKA